MARPWYVQAADASHRLVVLGILGYSGWLVYGTTRTISANAARNEAKKAEAASIAAKVETEESNSN